MVWWWWLKVCFRSRRISLTASICHNSISSACFGSFLKYKQSLFACSPPSHLLSFPPPFLPSSSLNGADRSLNSSLGWGGEGGEMNSIFLIQEEVKDGCKPTAGKLKHVNLTHRNILHIPASLNTNNLPSPPSPCAVGGKSCTTFILRWNYRLRFNCFLSITRSSLTATHWPAVCSHRLESCFQQQKKINATARHMMWWIWCQLYL